MRSPSFTFAACVLLVCASARGQSPSLPVSGGLFLAIGGESHDIPTQPSAIGTSLVGAYVEWSRHLLQPGVDLRGAGGTLGVRGTLVGPRVSVSLRPFHPYAEGLFGPAHFDLSSTSPSSSSQSFDRHGVLSEVAIGVDVDIRSHLRWRVLELTQGTFSGIPGAHPRTLTTGLVVHLP